ncbi:MAG: YkgJ family cysteine cluster protein [Clostridia bacterium]|jgi:Fe-S-cluster containining protein|nr:YkgJ family cysteine cluster protein [Clostridia bacterium]MDH7572358.1 YkgJ family cysteine cluster protein [Clostridia bacterium]
MVRVELVPFGGECGYDLLVLDSRATVGDYLRAMELLSAEPRLARRRNPGGACYGCPRCCAERIPLTSIDALRLGERSAGGGKAAGTGPEAGRGRGGLSEGRFRPEKAGEPAAGETAGRALKAVRAYGWVGVWGRAVDITLRRGEEGECVLLDRQAGLCRRYDLRPLVCRTYLCSPVTRRARRLRETLVNLGQDELVRLLLECAGPEGFPINEADAPDLRPEDWTDKNAFSGKTDYGQVLLREVLPARLWQEVYRPSAGS